MTAYMIAELIVRDTALMADYGTAARSSIEAHGGSFVVRGGLMELVEGERPPGEQVIVVAFPSLDAARTWYSSPEYAKALAVKDAAMTRRVTFVEGA